MIKIDVVQLKKNGSALQKKKKLIKLKPVSVATLPRTTTGQAKRTHAGQCLLLLYYLNKEAIR